MTARTAFDRLDRNGIRLHIDQNHDETIVILDDGRTCQHYQLDTDAAIGLAHDLLERCGDDSDEVVVARAALRELERREPADWLRDFDFRPLGP